MRAGGAPHSHRACGTEARGAERGHPVRAQPWAVLLRLRAVGPQGERPRCEASTAWPISEVAAKFSLLPIYIGEPGTHTHGPAR
jgi:hypothetical protein